MSISSLTTPRSSTRTAPSSTYSRRMTMPRDPWPSSRISSF
jgi:hypothetical protein